MHFASIFVTFIICATGCNFDVTRPEKTGEVIRLQYGGWETQITNNYIFLVFLRDYLNLNAVFWPVSGIDEWKNITNYPISTHEWLAHNEIDLSLEMWPYSKNDRVQELLPSIEDLGDNGMYTTMSWYVPDYLADLHPEIIEDPSLLAQHQAKFIKDNGRFEILAVDETWTMTIQSKQLLQAFSLNATVTTLGSEAALTDKLDDLLSHRKWFIVVHYEPHLDFKYMPLEPLKVNCNLTQLSDCWYPTRGKVYKYISRRVNETMPHVKQYVQNFHITNEEMYDIILLIGVAGSYERAICGYLRDHGEIFDQILYAHLWTTSTSPRAMQTPSALDDPKHGLTKRSDEADEQLSLVLFEVVIAVLSTLCICAVGIWYIPALKDRCNLYKNFPALPTLNNVLSLEKLRSNSSNQYEIPEDITEFSNEYTTPVMITYSTKGTSEFRSDTEEGLEIPRLSTGHVIESNRSLMTPKAPHLTRSLSVDSTSRRLTALSKRAAIQAQNFLSEMGYEVFIGEEEVVMKEEIGRGNFGLVKRGLYKGADCACKLHKTSDFESNDLETVILEIRAIKMIRNHLNVINLYGVILTDENLIMVMEYLKDGSCADVFKSGGTFTKFEKIEIMKQAAAGIWAIHDSDVVHRDIACRNVLIDLKAFRVVVADFGLTTHLLDDIENVDMEENIPIRWAAPETLMRREYTPASDIWSFGVFCWEVLHSGVIPYASHSLKDVCTGIVQGTLSLQMDVPRDDELESLISACMDRSPDLRPTIDEIHKTITENYEHLSNC